MLQLYPQPTPVNHLVYDQCSCVSYVKAKRDLTVPIGNPWDLAHGRTDLTVYKIDPFVGAIVVLREGPVWHAAYVESVHGDTFTVSEANYVPCKTTSRTLLVTDPDIVGYL